MWWCLITQFADQFFQPVETIRVDLCSSVVESSGLGNIRVHYPKEFEAAINRKTQFW